MSSVSREGTKPTGAHASPNHIIHLAMYNKCEHLPADYQWDTTRPVKGETLSDEWLAAGFANAIMQLAKTVRV